MGEKVNLFSQSPLHKHWCFDSLYYLTLVSNHYNPATKLLFENQIRVNQLYLKPNVKNDVQG